MTLFKNIISTIEILISNWKSAKKEKQYQRQYPDYKGETEYDCGEYIFIWGIKSGDDICQTPACLHTMNDIDLMYSRKEKRYILSIETAFWFDSKEQEIEYLTSLLNAFTEYMIKNNLSTDEQYRFWMSQPSILFEGDSIPEVYTNFKIFVEGYKTIYKNAITSTNPKIQLL